MLLLLSFTQQFFRSFWNGRSQHMELILHDSISIRKPRGPCTNYSSIKLICFHGNFTVVCWLWVCHTTTHSFQRIHCDAYELAVWRILVTKYLPLKCSLVPIYSHFINGVDVKRSLCSTSKPIQSMPNFFRNRAMMCFCGAWIRKTHTRTRTHTWTYVPYWKSLHQCRRHYHNAFTTFLPMANRIRHKNKKIGNVFFFFLYLMEIDCLRSEWMREMIARKWTNGKKMEKEKTRRRLSGIDLKIVEKKWRERCRQMLKYWEKTRFGGVCVCVGVVCVVIPV